MQQVGRAVLKRLCYNGNMEESVFRRGFTIIELSLSLVFISTLSLTVVMVIAGAISSYHKSITMNEVNTVGTSLVDDMQASIHEASTSKLINMCNSVYKNGNSDCESNNARRFTLVTQRASVKSKSGEELGNMPVFGALCTGSYSYIWNSGYFFNSDYIVGGSLSRASLKYNGSNIKSDFKLLKVKDEDRAVCVAAVRVQQPGVVSDNYSNTNMLSQFDISLPGLVKNGEAPYVDEEPLELLSGGSEGMALYELSTVISEQKGIIKNVYYYSSFILGTVQGGININATGDYCKIPGEYDGLNENFNYCAINKFNFAALANGG